MILIVFLLLQLPPAVDLEETEPQVAAKIEKLMRDVRDKPASHETWGKLAMNLHIHDFTREAIAAYEHAIEKRPRDFQWIYLRAVALQEIGSARTVGALQHAVQIKPDYAPARLRLAQALHNAGQLRIARQEFEAILRADPRSAHAHLGLAQIAVAEEKVADAIKHASKAVELKPDLAEARGLLAEIYRRSGEAQKMIEELKQSQQLPQNTGPRDPILLELAREGVSAYWYETRGHALLQQRDYRAAIAELKKAVRAKPEARVYDLLGIAYRAQNNHREAIEQHLKAVELKPESAESWHNLASAYAADSQRKKAIESWQKASELAKDNPDLLREIQAGLEKYHD